VSSVECRVSSVECRVSQTAALVLKQEPTLGFTCIQHGFAGCLPGVTDTPALE
jgi:hypothetical protein